MSDAIKQAIEALRECLSTLSDFGLESSDAYQQVLAALQAMPGEAVIPEWISVDERLPEADTPVLAIVDGYDGLLTVERRWERCDQMTEPYYKDFLYWDWVDNDGQDFEDRVRFWMRLPEPPTLLPPAKGCAPRHQWDDGGERCVKCGDKDWFAGAVCDESKLLSAATGVEK